ncbi:MAG: hypothetical protein RJB38_565 [Pseudomonadota bacterium]|jgi:histidine triad (HIT) family protein
MQNSSCVFCKIIGGEIPSARVYEDSDFIVIRDIQPQARTHLLLIPKVHLDALDDASVDGERVRSTILGVAVQVAQSEGLSENGYRLVTNVREWGGQTVRHLHLHVLGGEPLRGRFA